MLGHETSEQYFMDGSRAHLKREEVDSLQASGKMQNLYAHVGHETGKSDERIVYTAKRSGKQLDEALTGLGLQRES